MTCRPGCGACCIAASISSPLPGMPSGKPAGARCLHLDSATFRCSIWGSAEYPDVCRALRPEPQMCGASREEALARLFALEALTMPEHSAEGYASGRREKRA